MYTSFWVQIIGVLAAGAYAVTVTAILLWILKKTIGLRVSRDEEIIGLDQTLHSESGYDL